MRIRVNLGYNVVVVLDPDFYLVVVCTQFLFFYVRIEIDDPSSVKKSSSCAKSSLSDAISNSVFLTEEVGYRLNSRIQSESNQSKL